MPRTGQVPNKLLRAIGWNTGETAVTILTTVIRATSVPLGRTNSINSSRQFCRPEQTRGQQPTVLPLRPISVTIQLLDVLRRRIGDIDFAMLVAVVSFVAQPKRLVRQPKHIPLDVAPIRRWRILRLGGAILLPLRLRLTSGSRLNIL